MNACIVLMPHTDCTDVLLIFWLNRITKYTYIRISRKNLFVVTSDKMYNALCTCSNV